MESTLLVVDDDPAVSQVLAALLKQAGFQATSVESAEQALERMRSSDIDLLITDLKLDGMDGLQLLRAVTREWPDVPVMMLTAHGTVAGAVEAMKAGAADYLLKPFDREEVLYTVRKALEGARRPRAEPPRPAIASSGLIGDSASMRELESLLTRAARTQATVLLRGESGTGKELAARTLHQQSSRSKHPFIVVNCGALPEGLLESELFGYERGAFTGASSRKPGRVELAENGTLFLDEIGDLPMAMQVKLLRLIQDREYEPLGSTRGKKADVRFVAATHRPLEDMIASGAFREDLFYRLNVLTIWLPPLRAHREDIPLLVLRFCDALAERDGRKPVRFSDEALAVLADEQWPGNVRQLQNFVERVVVLAEEATISADRVVEELNRSHAPDSSRSTSPSADRPVNSLELTRARAEREAVALALQRAGGNRTVAARILGISRRTLYNKLSE